MNTNLRLFFRAGLLMVRWWISSEPFVVMGLVVLVAFTVWMGVMIVSHPTVQLPARIVSPRLPYVVSLSCRPDGNCTVETGLVELVRADDGACMLRNTLMFTDITAVLVDADGAMARIPSFAQLPTPYPPHPGNSIDVPTTCPKDR